MRGAHLQAEYKLSMLSHTNIFICLFHSHNLSQSSARPYTEIIFETLQHLYTLKALKLLKTSRKHQEKVLPSNILASSNAPAGQIQSIFNPVLPWEMSALEISMATHCFQHLRML